MNKIPTFTRPAPAALLLAVVCLLLAGISGCGPNHGEAGGGKPAINEDTLRNHVIPIELAIQYTKAFRGVLDERNHFNPKAIDSLTFNHAEEFPSDVFLSLLDQSNAKQGRAKGIRIYLGRDEKGVLKLVLVPVDSLGNDIINHLVDVNGKPVPGSPRVEALQASGGQTIEVGQLCPTICDNGGSGLNQ